MEEPTARSVRGRFDGAVFEGRSVTAAFLERDGRFLVRTDGMDGKPADFPVSWTFGVAPLQQYLVPFPGGRFQAFGVAWDDRPSGAGGQRWYDLYPDQSLKPGDPLHWTGIDQTWNYQCAECHSTNLRKGYDAATRSYKTTWSETDVSCEACHGPGSRHVEWAKAGGEPGAEPARGLLIRLPGAGTWAWDATAGKPVHTGESRADVEVEACGRCHARRGVLTEDYAYGQPLLATHAPALLTEGLYYPDGQIQDEVFEYGSFRQSRMFQAGVGCSDCHEPHSLELRAEGDALCSRCHSPAKFAAAAHTGHPVAPKGAPTGAPTSVGCVDCHMPEGTYMGVDRRRDHSLRIPRPDLTVRIGTPNACAACHADKPAAWAAAAVGRWHGPVDSARHYGEVLHAARSGDAASASGLAALATDAGLPAILRATALTELARFPGPMLEPAIVAGAGDAEALVRYAAALALEGLPTDLRIRAAGVLLDDPVLGVRAEAARWLAGASPDLMTSAQAAALSRAVDDFRATLAVNADRPEAQLNLGNLEQALGRNAEAESAYRVATEIDPGFAPAWANLADATRARGDEAAAGAILRAALIRLPDNAGLHHASGLALVRGGDLPAALAALERATQLDPGSARFAYVYGIALNSAGQTPRALDTLAAASRRHPADRDILLALATINRDAGRLAEARTYAERLVAGDPDDAAAAALLSELTSG